MTFESLNQQVGKHHGKGGWPVDLIYEAKEDADSVEVAVSDAGSANDGVWKRIDTWGFAFVYEVQKVTKITKKQVRLTFSVRSPNAQVDKCQYEALKRRVSYLAVANDDLQITLVKGSVDPLYSWTDLTNPNNSRFLKTRKASYGTNTLSRRCLNDQRRLSLG